MTQEKGEGEARERPSLVYQELKIPMRGYILHYSAHTWKVAGVVSRQPECRKRKCLDARHSYTLT